MSADCRPSRTASARLAPLPKEEDFIVMEVPANSAAFKVDRVTFLFNEDAVRLIVSPIGI